MSSNRVEYINLPFSRQYVAAAPVPYVKIQPLFNKYSIENIYAILNHAEVKNDMERINWKFANSTTTLNFSYESQMQGLMVTALQNNGITATLNETNAIAAFVHSNNGVIVQGGSFGQTLLCMQTWVTQLDLSLDGRRLRKEDQTSYQVVNKTKKGDFVIHAPNKISKLTNAIDLKPYVRNQGLIVLDETFILRNQNNTFTLETLSEGAHTVRIEKNFFTNILLPIAHQKFDECRGKLNVETAFTLVPFMLDKEFADKMCEMLVTQTDSNYVEYLLEVIEECFKFFPAEKQKIYLTLLHKSHLCVNPQILENIKYVAIFTAVDAIAGHTKLQNSLREEAKKILTISSANPATNAIPGSSLLVGLVAELKTEIQQYINRLREECNAEIAATEVAAILAKITPDFRFALAVKAALQPDTHIKYNLVINGKTTVVSFQDLDFTNSLLFKKLGVASTLYDLICAFEKTEYKSYQAFDDLRNAIHNRENQKTLKTPRANVFFGLIPVPVEQTTSATTTNKLIKLIDKIANETTNTEYGKQTIFLSNLIINCEDYLWHTAVKISPKFENNFTLSNARELCDPVKFPETKEYLRNKIILLLGLIDKINSSEKTTDNQRSQLVSEIHAQITSPGFKNTLEFHQNGYAVTLFQNASEKFLTHIIEMAEDLKKTIPAAMALN